MVFDNIWAWYLVAIESTHAPHSIWTFKNRDQKLMKFRHQKWLFWKCEVCSNSLLYAPNFGNNVYLIMEYVVLQ